MNFTLGITLLCSIALASGFSLDVQSIVASIEHPLPGPSPNNFTQQSGFDREQAGGKWYGHYMINVGLPNLPIHCWSFVASDGEDQNIEAAVTLYPNTGKINVPVNMHITVVPIEGEQAKYIMKQLTFGPLTTSMVVLTTDYKNYFVKMDLFDIAGLGHALSVNVYSRSAEEMNPDTVEQIQALIAQQGITEQLVPVPQNCPSQSIFSSAISNLIGKFQ